MKEVIIYHFPCKDMLIKVILDLFISNIDQELFKGVLGKVFKSKDIQQSDNEVIVLPENSKTHDKEGCMNYSKHHVHTC